MELSDKVAELVWWLEFDEGGKRERDGKRFDKQVSQIGNQEIILSIIRSRITTSYCYYMKTTYSGTSRFSIQVNVMYT